MCLGIPVRVVRMEGTYAVCEGRDGEEVRLDTLLVGDIPAGTWLLSHLGAAREVLDEPRARQISRAIDGLAAALEGGTELDGFFDDLINREPQLPPHLQVPIKEDTP